MGKRHELLTQTDALLRGIDNVLVAERVERLLESAAPGLGGATVVSDDPEMSSEERTRLLVGCTDWSCPCNDGEVSFDVVDDVPLLCDYDLTVVSLNEHRIRYEYWEVENEWIRRHPETYGQLKLEV